ncbi:Fibrocystin [Apodemus speciosus]|uniref:Fibrocystin n=1 Tax=Apodemus speciosus TaxID=105296 RepID=A0ABQ0ED93_APOSI
MMPAWLISLLSVEILLLASTLTRVSTWNRQTVALQGEHGSQLFLTMLSLDRSILYPNNGSQLEIDLVNVAIPALRIPCDVSPIFEDLPAVTCRTRSLPSEAQAGLYSLEIRSGEQVLDSLCPGSLDSCTFKFSKEQTPLLYQVNPASGVPDSSAREVVHVYGRIIADRLETFDPDVDYMEGPLILEAGEDKWLTPCSLINWQTGSLFQNVSFSVFNKGVSMVHKEAWLISAKQELFLYQTHPEILSVFPKVGSLGGRTDITITGDFFDPSARVTIAARGASHVILDMCLPGRLSAPPGLQGTEQGSLLLRQCNRGLLFEVGDAVKDMELTEATPGYSWQIVPNASSPSGFWSKEGRPFRARLSGFFVAPETNNYTFWIQADSQASLRFSSSEEPRTKEEVASVGVGTADWFDSWELDGDEGSWQQKTNKLELRGGDKYYLEAEHHGIAPSKGMRIGVQIHNTWLNPDVVNTYLLEKHQIQARAQRLPEIQVLNVSGKGDFFLTWGNVSSQPVPANATAQQIQATIEELLVVRCSLTPFSAHVLLRLGFEQGLEGSRSDGVLTSSTEPFCGRFSLGQLRHLILSPKAANKGYQLDRYPYLCFAYRGHMNRTLDMTVSFLFGFQNIMKNITCDWSLAEPHPERWQFTCINLWDTCVCHSEGLQCSLANTPLLVHRIDIVPLAPEAGLLYVDEIILADTNVTVSQADSGGARPGGNVVESVSVVGVPALYSLAFWLVGCGSELPLITACYVLEEGTGEGSELLEVTAQRLQRTSPPLGGHFLLHLSDTAIPDVPVHISARQLRKLLQDNADASTSGYLNANDFTVTEDLNSCYEHVWTLSWTTQIGDLPNFIRKLIRNVTISGLRSKSYWGESHCDCSCGIRWRSFPWAHLRRHVGYCQPANSGVAVQVNDIPAHCSGSCSFQYQHELTPSVDQVWYSLGSDVNLLVHFTGTGFPRDAQFLQVAVNKASCEVIFSNETAVACELAPLPVGAHPIFMLVRPAGLAVNASGEGLFLHVEPRLDAVEPSTAAEIVGFGSTFKSLDSIMRKMRTSGASAKYELPQRGQWVTLRGSSLEGVSLVLFGTQSCIIDVIRSNSQQIQCKVPPRGKDGYNVNVTVITGDHHSIVLARAFTYVSSLNPVIVSLSRNRSSIAGGEILFLGMALLVNYTDLDVQIYIQNTSAQVLAQTALGLEVALPPLLPGLHMISVFINGISIHSQGVDLHIQYLTEVFRVEPCSGSLLAYSAPNGQHTQAPSGHYIQASNGQLKHPVDTTLRHPANTKLKHPEDTMLKQGGTILRLSGAGLGRDPALIRVLVNNRPCNIVNLTEVDVWCETPPAVLPSRADVLTVPASVEIWAGNTSLFHGPSSVGKGFTFTYEAAATPVVTAIWGELMNNSVRFLLEGNNLSDSVILLGSLKCDLEVQFLADNMNLSGCSLPLHSLEAGVYPLQVRDKRMGFANMSAVSQKFELSPQIMDVFPVHGSKCGGTVLTVKGMAFTSRRRSVHVDLSGPFACMILSLEDHTVLCQTSLVGDQFSEASMALNITVLVNGLSSKCEGNCTIFMEEVTTPVVDALTVSISGSLTTVLMRGQRLGTTADEPKAFVDDQLPCHTAFFNASHVACQMRDLAPGPHYLSAVHTSAGYACLSSVSRNFFIMPQVFDYFPKDFSIHGGSLLTIKGTALRGRKATFVYVGQQACLTVNISSECIQCIVPAGNGSVALEIEVDGVSYPMGFVDYSSIFTPGLLSVSRSHDILTFTVAQISGAANVDIFIGTSPCLGVSGNRTVLRCMVPLLPAGEYLVTGYDHSRGWASSALSLVLRATVTSVTENYGFPKLMVTFPVSLAFLCDLRHAEDSCEVSSPTYVQCDLTVSVGTERLPGSWPYIYLCEERSPCLSIPDHWAEPVFLSFSGLFFSPKVERDEVLIYNSSCNITMETEAETECETPNQPITAKITEIQKSCGQNTQGNFSFRLCRRWSRPHSWFPQRVPQDGDSVTVETSNLLLLDVNTSFLNSLHIKGGKLIFMEPGPIELRAHSILITDGGELRIGSEHKPFQGKARIKLYGSAHSIPVFPYGIKFLAVRNGTLSLHGSVPEVTVTYLRAAAHAGDTVLALEEAVDWRPGDEAVIISGMTVEGAEATEEVVIVETVHSADLHLRNPLRYSYNFTENWIAGGNYILKATVALLSRNIIIQGNLTLEREKFLDSCQEASAAEGRNTKSEFMFSLTLRNLKHCLYSKSEKMLGARDLGARIIIQSFPEEPSLVKLKGVHFRDLGQAFHKQLSSLTLVGAMRGSYLQSCSVRNSFSRGLSMHRTGGLKVDSNIFYKIVGHALLVGSYMDRRFTTSETVTGRKNGWWEQGSTIRNNVIISVAGVEGLSSSEMLAPAGIYTFSPTSVIEGYGLLVYPEFQPSWNNDTDFTLFQNFMVWGSAGGAQGGFTVKTRQLKFVNSSNLVAFPFPHAAVLEDLDGSLSGKEGSHVLASMETLSDMCLANASFSQIVSGSVCGEAVLFHRMSVGLANSLDIPKNLTITDIRNKTITVNYVDDTLSNYYGWMALLLDQETYSLQFEGPWMDRSLQYSATFDSFAPGNHLLLVHRDLPPYPDILLRCGSRLGQSLPSHPLPRRDRACDWFFNKPLRQLTYLGEGQVQVFLQVKPGAPPTVSASTSVPESALKWSLPETWQDAEKGWGGYNHSIPGPGDDVLILPNKTILVDTDLPVLGRLYVMGTLEFPVDRSNVLSVACLLIAGGELKVGSLENPLEKDQRLLILLRASEEIFCDHFDGLHVDPGMIGVYGKLRLHSAYPKKSWVHLGADIAQGNERIIVHDTVDWQPHDTIVLSSSSYEPHEAEVLTVKEVKGHHIRIYERLQHRHIGSAHIMEDGQQISLAAEVGLLTRNIRIQPDSSCRGRLLVGSFRKSSGEDFSGVLQLLNVEIQNMGSSLHSSVEFTGVSAGSWVLSSAVHQSCSVGIRASSSHGVILKDNIVFATNGHGIDVEGQNYSLINNLVVLTMQPANSFPWVAGIKVNYAEEIILHGNVVAGSERLGFHIGGHGCSSEVLWSDNVVHSSLHGLHLYKKREPNNCTGVSGFLAFKNFDYGAMVQTENSVDIQNITLVDNTVGLLAIAYVSSAPMSSVSPVQITLRNSVIVATSSSFDCIHDRKAPQSADWTSTDRAPSNPRGGRIGILWPVSASEPSGWPQEPWHKVRSGHSVPGMMKLQDVTFSSFVKSCYSDDLDVCILPNEYSAGVMYPITAERTRMLRIKDKNKFYFPPLQPRKDLVGTICPELDCEYPRKYLFTDLDGRTLGLPPPVSVFPRTEAEWTESFFNTGIFREEQKCTFRAMIPGFFCKQTEHAVLILDNVDATWTIPTSYPLVSITNGFVDTFSIVKDSSLCSPTTTLSTFYSIFPTRQMTKVCFPERTPPFLRFLLLGNRRASKLILAVFYNEMQSPHVFLDKSFIPPTPVESAFSLLDEAAGANYFDIMNNLLYVVLQEAEPVEIHSSVSIQLALMVTFSVLEKDWERKMLESLTGFFQIDSNQIRLTLEMPGNKETLEAIANSEGKRKRNCPTVICGGPSSRYGQRRPLMAEMTSFRITPATTLETFSKVVVVEIGDLPNVRNSELIQSLPRNRLQKLAHQVITAQQTGVLENVLGMTVGALLVTQPEGVSGYRNAMGNERVESLGLPSKPWIISVSLEGASESMLKGCTQAEAQDEDIRMQVMQRMQSQFSQHSRDGVSKRKVSRRAVPEERTATPAPKSPRITCVPGAPAQQPTLQEPGNWQEAQQQLLRYQLAGRDQLLLLCPDLRQERQQGQEPSPLNKGSGCMELSQGKAACVPTETFCLHTAPPETIQ